MKICLFGEMEDPQITWSGEGWNPNEQWGIQQEYKTIVIYKSPLIPSQPISIYLPRGTAKPIYPTTTISHFAQCTDEWSSLTFFLIYCSLHYMYDHATCIKPNPLSYIFWSLSFTLIYLYIHFLFDLSLYIIWTSCESIMGESSASYIHMVTLL